ncbi:TRAP transporter TatT component family protein [candidate division TA06 bacterium]|nr:TRAP transporter TatT component family protein [candidate division TA06 bacterium]
MAADQTTAIIVKAMPAYDRETDLELAEQAIAGNLKFFEGLLEVTPNNPDLLLVTSSSFSRYTYGFIEEKIDIADGRDDFKEKERLVTRAIDFYGRARKYGFKLITQSRKDFPEILEQDLKQLSSELKFFKKKDVPALFWTAFAWGNIINLQQRDPARLAELPKVELMMQRVLELDENYFFGSVHLFYGVYYGSRPEILGGNPEKARQHLQRSIEITNGKYLMAKFLLARYYAVPVQDRKLFEDTLQEILSAPPDLLPEQGLANELAKRRAELWLKRADKLFF